MRPPFRRGGLGREPGEGVVDRPASGGDGSARREMRATAGLGDRQRDVVPAAHLKMRGGDALAGFEVEPVWLPGNRERDVVTDAYATFSGMLDGGNPPDGFDALMQAAKAAAARLEEALKAAPDRS